MEYVLKELSDRNYFDPWLEYHHVLEDEVDSLWKKLEDWRKGFDKDM